MEKQVMLVFAAMALTAAVLGAGPNCTSTCTGYKTCSSIVNATNHTGFLADALVCSKDSDSQLGVLFQNMSGCALTGAAIEVADLLNITWDGVSSLEAIIGDQDFWKKECSWQQLAAAACVYFSLPAKSDTCAKGKIAQESLFCTGECKKIADSCFNLKKYRHLEESIDDFCTSVTATDKDQANCYKGQIDQSGLSAPDCTTNALKTTSLTGPYILAGIALALAVVGLIGLALITCKSGAGGGQPNSF